MRRLLSDVTSSKRCSVPFTNQVHTTLVESFTNLQHWWLGRTIQQSVAIRDYFTRIYNKQTLSSYTTMLLSQFLPIFKISRTSCFHKLFCPTRTGKLAQSNLYISIASGPGGAMLLIRLRIYRGFKYATVLIGE